MADITMGRKFLEEDMARAEGEGKAGARIRDLEAELTQAHADNAKLETLWENAVAARDKLSEELTQARAERDAAREALEKADKMNEVLNASTSGHFWADIADAQEEYIAARAAIKAEGE